MISALVVNGLFTPYGVGPQESMPVSHLQFTDDTLLIGVKSWANVRALKAVQFLFEAISELKVNFHKSMLFGVNVNDFWLHEADLVMNCKHGRIPFLYVGLPIGGDPRKLQFSYLLVERIRSRLSGWKCKNLSLGCRLVLLKPVLSSIPIYFLSFFIAPSCIISTLNSLFNNFFFGGRGGGGGGGEDFRKLSWIKWDTICLKGEWRFGCEEVEGV